MESWIRSPQRRNIASPSSPKCLVSRKLSGDPSTCAPIAEAMSHSSFVVRASPTRLWRARKPVRGHQPGPCRCSVRSALGPHRARRTRHGTGAVRRAGASGAGPPPMMSPNASRALARRDGFASAAASKVVSEQPRISACSAPPWFPSADARRSPSSGRSARTDHRTAARRLAWSRHAVQPGHLVWASSACPSVRRGRRSTSQWRRRRSSTSLCQQSLDGVCPHRFQHSHARLATVLGLLDEQALLQERLDGIEVDAKRSPPPRACTRRRRRPTQRMPSALRRRVARGSNRASREASAGVVGHRAVRRPGRSAHHPSARLSPRGSEGRAPPRRAQWPGHPVDTRADIRNGKGVGFVEHEAEIARPAALHEELDCRRPLNAPGIELLL